GPDGRAVVELASIRRVTFRSRARGAVHGLAFGALTGGGLGALAGLGEGDDGDDCSYVCFTAGEKAVMYAVVFGGLGALVGAAVGASVGATEIYEFEGFDDVKRPRPRARRWLPTVAPTEGGATAGVVGRF